MKICFVVAPQNQNTILDRIAHEIGRAFDEPIYHYGTTGLPQADHYFVTHYSMLPQVFAQEYALTNNVTAFYTHNKGNAGDFAHLFNICHSVVAESPEGMKELASFGVRQDILHFVPECGDNEAFKPHARTQEGAILICGTNYADGRKNPELIKEVIKLLPNKKFLYIGINWDKENNLTQEESLDRLYGKVQYRCHGYKDYPKLFSECSVYLSCSKLEGGGPNSLIEAMHANLVPVVSDTGNARQYIVDGYNGFIFPLDATAEQVAELIEKAYKVDIQNALPYADIWQTVKNMTWKEYGLNMREIITGDYSITTSQNLDEVDYSLGDN